MVMNVDENTSINKLFFYYILTKQDFRTCITGSSQPQIVRNPLLKFKLFIPSSKEEQVKIANFLNCVDEEIIKQTEILNQLKLQKQSLMQKLLTGEARIFDYSRGII
jgi:type I restriction enzyme S subunit